MSLWVIILLGVVALWLGFILWLVVWMYRVRRRTGGEEAFGKIEPLR
jgi:hypothetical protein